MPLTTDDKLLALSREIIDTSDKVNGGIHPGLRPSYGHETALGLRRGPGGKGVCPEKPESRAAHDRLEPGFARAEPVKFFAAIEQNLSARRSPHPMLQNRTGRVF